MRPFPTETFPSRLHLSISKRPARGSRSTTGGHTAVVHCNARITRHGRDGNVEAAESVFTRMPFKTPVSWTAMLTAYAHNGLMDRARHLFDVMPHRTTPSYNAMITAYLRNGLRVDKALRLFSDIPRPDAVSYSAMITGLVQAGLVDTARMLHRCAPARWRDPACSNALLTAYLKMGALDEAVRVFEGMAQRDVVSYGSMIHGYCKEGGVLEARELFDQMPERNVITWTAMINGYLRMGLFSDGFILFLDMRREGAVGVNSTTLTVIVEACTDSERSQEGRQLHALVFLLGFQSDVFLGNSMINMYCRLGSTEAAAEIFSMLSAKDVVTWNCLIAGYAESGEVEEAYRLFREMPVKDLVSWTTMIAGFSSIRMTRKSIELFEMVPVKDDIAWTALISGLVNNEEYEEAFRWFIKMLRAATRPNPLTLSTVLSGSAGLAELNQGMQVHAYALKTELEYNLSVQNSLVSMYSKCGNMTDAHRIFTEIRAPNIVSYNSIITGLAQNGFGVEAVRLFKQMQNPNEVTFLAVLSACCHAGLVEEGWGHFRSMKSAYGIEPRPDHYACMVDLLGRAGLLDEAMSLIQSMPCEPHTGVWGALLSASKTYSRLELAELAARNLMRLQPDSAAPYVVLSNIYGESEKQGKGDSVRMEKISKGLKKSPGCSWIIVKDSVQSFLAGDKSHPNIGDIEATMRAIAKDTQVRSLEILM